MARNDDPREMGRRDMARRDMGGAPGPRTAYADDDRWYERWISSIADDVASHMAGEEGREARLQRLRDSFNRMRRRLVPGRLNHRGRGPRGYARSDERIREDVCDRLTVDRYVDATEIEVSVAEGIVTLSGTVENRAEKRLAEDAVDTVPGVRDVNNNLRIREHAKDETEPRETDEMLERRTAI